MELGLQTVPVHIAEISDKDARAYRIADNQTGSLSGWDYDLLRGELSQLFDDDFDMGTLAFDSEDLRRILEDDLQGRAARGVIRHDLGELPAVPAGSLWALGDHRLFRGDALDPASFSAVLQDEEKADMCLTDPPYNVAYTGVVGSPRKAIKNDAQSLDKYRSFSEAFAKNLSSFVRGCVYVFGPSGPDGRVLFGALDRAMHTSATLVWVKNSLVMGRGKYHHRHELIWFGWVQKARHFTRKRDLDTVWEFDRPTSSKLHPTMKPLELLQYAIAHASHTGDTVLDPFGGSGSTLLACENTARRCRMIELDEEYCGIILRRWEIDTGKTAERIS